MFNYVPSFYEIMYLSLSLVFSRVLDFNPSGTEASVFIQESLLAAVVDPGFSLLVPAVHAQLCS